LEFSSKNAGFYAFLLRKQSEDVKRAMVVENLARELNFPI